MADYAPILVMLVLAGGFVAVSLMVSRVFAPDDPTPEKLDPYECGIVPEVGPSQRFPVKFYLVAMLFVIFDVEAVFFYPWGATFRETGVPGLVAIGQVAERLGVSRRTARRWIDAGKLPHVRLPGGGVRVSVAHLEHALAESAAGLQDAGGGGLNHAQH